MSRRRKVKRIIFRNKFGGTPHQERNGKEREVCRDATWQKPKLNKCVDLGTLIDSWWDWSRLHGSSLEPLDKHFSNHGFVYKPQKISELKKNATISAHDVRCLPSGGEIRIDAKVVIGAASKGRF